MPVAKLIAVRLPIAIGAVMVGAGEHKLASPVPTSAPATIAI